MIRRSRLLRFAVLPLLCVGSLPWSVAFGGQTPPDEKPAITRAQIEADWLHQDALRKASATPSGSQVSRQQDAAGGCDGVKNGKWGFHTEMEENPWWQIDLQQPTAIERIVLYNRCDLAERNSRILVWASDDGKSFRQVYRHDGTVFYGFTDKKPLVVSLKGLKTRYVRLGLSGKSYFHLDEAEIYPVGENRNVALHKPATQSSTSQWSALHGPGGQAFLPVAGPGGQAFLPVVGSGGQAFLPVATALGFKPYEIARVVERGLRLAASQRRLGARVDAEEKTLRDVAEQWQALVGPAPSAVGEKQPDVAGTAGPTVAPEQAQRDLYFRARWAVRKMALGNPLLDFEAIVFCKSAPTRFPHMSDQFYGWWSRPGGGIFILEGFKGDKTGTGSEPTGPDSGKEGRGEVPVPVLSQPKVRCLTAGWAPGTFLRPDLSYDGKKVVFAYCKFFAHVPDLRNKADKANVPEDAFYHVFVMNLDGSGVRQLTRGRYDDFDARYLPSGEIVFLSTRKGVFLQTSKANTAATQTADLPDSYVRCGGDNYRPVPVFTLHAMDGDGRNLHPISAFENFEWTPAVANDGRILYTRWDYIDRFNGHFFSLWSTNPDGTNAQLVYKNYTVRPQVASEAMAIPGSQKVIFTASAHHSILGGSLCLLDRTRGTEEAAPLVRLTPEVPFPETEAWGDHYYANPWPLSEEYYLVGWADRRLPPHTRVETQEQNPTNAMGLYLYDAFGNQELLYRDPDISSGNPIPVRARPKPPAYAGVAADGRRGGQACLPVEGGQAFLPVEGGQAFLPVEEGGFFLQDVYRGLEGIPRGTIKRLRIVAVPPKVQPHMNNPNLGVSSEDPGKYVLGTVPVEADGSAHFRVPSGIPLFFQALDENGLAVQTMRSLTYVQPRQTLSCVGCHESRELAPPIQKIPLAATRQPSRIALGPSGSWPLRFDRLVQPVLDQHCVQCHDPKGTRAGGQAFLPVARASKLDLTAAMSYQSLLSFGGEDLKKLAFERDRSIPGKGTAANSKLYALLTQPSGHEGVRLDAEGLSRLATWMDTYAQRQGHFSEAQERELEKIRETWADLFVAGAAAAK